MEEGTLAKWLVKPGDTVRSGDIMAEIETDKATMEFEAVDEGVLAHILIQEGAENVTVGTVIAILAEEGEDIANISAPSKTQAPEQENALDSAPAPTPVITTGAKATPVAKRIAQANDIEIGAITGTGPRGKVIKADVESALGGSPATITRAHSSERIIASPLAKAKAASKGFDLNAITGTGPGGRIIERDVDNFVPSAKPATQSDATVKSSQSTPEFGAPFEEEKLSNVRKVIARRLTQSKQNVPHYYLTMDIRLDKLLDLRKDLNASLEPDGVKLSVNDLLIKALAKALIRVPQCNVSYHEDVMRKYSRADISVAVAAPSGLITPVITAADTKSLAVISKEMKELAGKARNGKLMPHEYQGGTASLSNLGMFGIKQFDAVINPPQGMILAVGAGQQVPYVVDGAIVPATVLHASGSFDHRAIDGADGAQLMQALKELIESPIGLVV